VLAAVHAPIARVLTQPLVALALFVGSFYVLYFSGLFDVALEQHWAHLAMNVHFPLVGALFFWPIVGIDPSPRPLPSIARLGLLFVAIPLHAFFGIAVMSSNEVIGSGFYQQLELPWVDRLADQTTGGGLAWATGEVPMLIVLIALLVQWSRADERTARRDDRRADRDGDRDLVAYNAMLQSLATTGRPTATERPGAGEDGADADRAADDQPAQPRADRGPRLAHGRPRNEGQQDYRGQPAPEHQRWKWYRLARRTRHHVIAAPERSCCDQRQCPEGSRRGLHTRSADRSWRARCETCQGSNRRSA
jgi:putative copper resistance protein D